MWLARLTPLLPGGRWGRKGQSPSKTSASLRLCQTPLELAFSPEWQEGSKEAKSPELQQKTPGDETHMELGEHPGTEQQAGAASWADWGADAPCTSLCQCGRGAPSDLCISKSWPQDPSAVMRALQMGGRQATHPLPLLTL